MIAVQNHATTCTDAEIELATKACSIQVQRDCAPKWGVPAVPVTYVPKGSAIPKGAWPVYILDDADQAGVLGWHTYDGNGVPYGRVFGRIIKQYHLEVSTVLSHEVLEAFVDPHVDQWRGGYALEVGDPVENDSYWIPVPAAAEAPTAARTEDDEFKGDPKSPKPPGIGTRVAVSNFALPNWWVSGSKGPWDLLSKATGPFKLTPGGYAITTSGTIWGERYEEWRKLVKVADGSRTLRRALTTGELVEADGHLEVGGIGHG